MPRRFLFLLLAAIICLSGAAIAQPAISNTHQQQMQRLISQNLWDDVMMLSTDLLIEYPHLGDGYYFAALAFYRIGDRSSAEEYLEIAGSFDGDDIQQRVQQLRGEMARETAITSSVEQIELIQQAGSAERAADEWRSLWQQDRQNIDFALNAVHLLIEYKRYPEALEILSHATVRTYPEAQRLINVINQTPEMVSMANYTNAMNLGRNAMEAGQWANAITHFRNALQAQPGDADASTLLQQAEDEQAWAAAQQTNTIQGYEAYLTGNMQGRYRQQAQSIIRNALLIHGTNAANQNNISAAESNLLKLIREYPQSNESAEARNQLCTLYTREGDRQASLRTVTSQTNAINQYEKAQQMCRDRSAIDSKIATAERRRTNWSRPNLSYVAFTHDDFTTYGLTIGGANNRSMGVYLTGAMNAAVLQGTADYTINDELILDGAGSGRYFLTGNDKISAIDGILGLTHKIYYPIWAYAGGGIRYQKLMWEIEEFSGNSLVDTVWVENTDQTEILPIFEAGMMMNLRGLHLRAGMKGRDLDNKVYTVGIGFSFQ